MKPEIKEDYAKTEARVLARYNQMYGGKINFLSLEQQLRREHALKHALFLHAVDRGEDT